MMIHQDLLDRCKIKKLVASLRCIQTSSAELAEKIRPEADYFVRNAKRMRYPKFRRQHLFVGTGVIEAGRKTMIGSRCQAVRYVLDRAARTPSWLCAAPNSTAALKTTGSNAPLESNFYVAHPSVSLLPVHSF